MQETLKNRTIFCRDNLEVLRGINSNSIDLIYLDPPFNTNKTYTAPIGSTAEGASFSDTFKEEDVKNEWVGLIAEEKPVLYNYLQGIKKVGHKSNFCYLVYMAIRLIECRRVLKETGSIYYHCDATMSHYIKLLMDCIFSEKNFRNEIVWDYKKISNAKGKKFNRRHDIILFYSNSIEYTFNNLYTEISERKNQLIQAGFNTKNMNGEKYIYIYDRERVKEKGIDLLKYDKVQYVDNKRGTLQSDVFDINIKNSMSKEHTGYPTQKPLALLERIIKASSNEDDTVLDPFCGCATTCVASEKLNRKWIGIDVSKKAFELVKRRLSKEIENKDPLFFKNKVHYREDIPVRTDIENKKITTDDRHYLFGLQEGLCKGCGVMFEFRHLEVDHIFPKSKGGGENIENLQLLCSSCNRIKGKKDMAYLKARLKEY